MLDHLLTFAIFLMIGVEIRDGLSHLRQALLPICAALGGMIFPALIFIAIATDKSAWATVMPTDVALAIGALSLLGRRVNPAVRLFLMTLAIADDFFSLVVIGIFFSGDLEISSAFYTLGAAAIGALLPFRALALRYLAPAITFFVIPIYIWINLLSHIDFGELDGSTSISILIARVIGKIIGITFTTWALLRFTSLTLPAALSITEVAGVGALSGMGMTVSLVIAEITIKSEQVFSEIRAGLLAAALLSALLGTLWLRFSPQSSLER
jgi:NhaA family Na+:H+ antiporter